MSDKKRVQSPEELVAYLLSIANEPADPEQIPAAANAEPVISARPGSHYAAAAYKAGREDEYIDAMNGRFGGEW
jgi:hypothetical protein